VLEYKHILRWVNLETVEAKGKQANTSKKLVFRRRARNTDERTMIAAILPPKSFFGHTLTGISCGGDIDALCAILNSITFDYLVRMRVAGEDILPFQLRACPIVTAVDLSQFENIKQIHANEQKIWIYDLEEYWEPLWLVEKEVAVRYGLNPNEYRLILETFQLFIRKRADLYEYLMQGIRKWYDDTQHELC